MNHVNFLSFDNDGRKPSKCQVSFMSLIFVLKCISKSILITIRDRETKKKLNWNEVKEAKSRLSSTFC